MPNSERHVKFTRAPRYSIPEQIVLLNEIEKRLPLVHANKLEVKQNAWSEIARYVTAANTKGEIRTGKQVQQKWYDTKCIAKKIWKTGPEDDDSSTWGRTTFAQKMISVTRTNILNNMNIFDSDVELNVEDAETTHDDSNSDIELIECKQEDIREISEYEPPSPKSQDEELFRILSILQPPPSDKSPAITVRNISRNAMRNHVEQTLTPDSPDTVAERPLTPGAVVIRTSTPGAVNGQTSNPSVVIERTLTSTEANGQTLTPGANIAAAKQTLNSVEDHMTLSSKIQKLKGEQEKLEIQRKLLNNCMSSIQNGQLTFVGKVKSLPALIAASNPVTQCDTEHIKSETPDIEFDCELGDVFSKLPEVPCNGELDESIEDTNMNGHNSDMSEEQTNDGPPPLKRIRSSTSPCLLPRQPSKPSCSLPKQPSTLSCRQPLTPSCSQPQQSLATSCPLPQQSLQDNKYVQDMKEILEILKESKKPPDPVTKDEDEQFMLSMATALKRIKPQSRCNIKMKIMKLIYESVFQPENGVT